MEQSPAKKEFIAKSKEFWNPNKTQFWQDQHVDLVIDRREGYLLYDMDGRRLIDVHLNGGTYNIGHRHPELIEVLHRGTTRFDMGNHHFPALGRTALAEELAKVCGGGMQYTMYTAGGAEAIDLAIKCARNATQKRKILSIVNAYHGHSGLSVATGADRFSKTFLADRRVRLNAAAFYLDWEDKQEQFFNGANFITSNAASASNLGFEVEFEALLTTDLTLSGALGHQDAEYDNFQDTATGVDNSGNALPYSPDWTGNLALDYSHTFAGGWALAMRGEALYNDKAYSDSSNDERWASDAYTRIDARIGMTSPSGRFGVALWGKNLTEEDYFLGGFEFFGTAYASINAPRTFGIEFRANL